MRDSDNEDSRQECGGSSAVNHSRRRPVTSDRTGLRGLYANAHSELSESAFWTQSASTRHTIIRHEEGDDYIAILGKLIETLEESGIPGPQLFRLNTEFSLSLGEGGQGNVRGLEKQAERQYRQSDKRIRSIWPAELIAIKQHIERKDAQRQEACFDTEDLSRRFKAAQCEVVALSPKIFGRDPNIVKLVGWGLCLDTMEDPANTCCGGLQLPLLVYERADMDFEQFLSRIFPESLRSDDVRVEEGLAGPHRPTQLEPHKPRLLSSMYRYWASLQQSLGLQPDPYDTVRLLCIDVGHGLRSLHEKDFTHGDLKPSNVLVFKVGIKWVAKLCDFGCAVGEVKKDKERYIGTPHWLPRASELRVFHTRESLRYCDLYVYGLLVWSSFCLGGQHPPDHPTLDDALRDLKQISNESYSWSPLLPNKQWLATQLTALMEGTLGDPSQRSNAPWSYLYRDQEQGGKMTVLHDVNSTGSIRKTPYHHLVGNSNSFVPHMTPEMKARYNTCSWWQHVNEDDGDMSVSSQDAFQEQQLATGAAQEFSDAQIPGPVSSTTLSPDDNCLSATLFTTPRRKSEAEFLCLDMVNHLQVEIEEHRVLDGLPPMDLHKWHENLYHMARFRSRVGLDWWADSYPSKIKNVLELALEASSPVDIHTLAWLCAGPVGKAEAKRLGASHTTWESLLPSGGLDESMRLDRFLLLLQSGAKVEQRVDRRYQPPEFNIQAIWDFGTIFSQYIRSCRSAALPTIIREIHDCLKASRGKGFISESTFSYFFVTGTTQGFTRARSDCIADGSHTAARALNQYFSNNSSSYWLPGGLAGSEQVPMLPMQPTANPELPHGWKKLGRRWKSRGSEYYEDEFTHSVTLTAPKVSPVQMRQVQVGFIKHNSTASCQIDLLSCMRAGAGRDKRDKFEQDLKHRFPYYDDAWYATEWNNEPNVEDVLGSLEETWRIQTFTSLLRTPGLMDKILAILRFSIAAVGSSVLALVMLAILAAIAYAMWITFRWVSIGMWGVWLIVLALGWWSGFNS
ncbi:unnamed protein product [Fusarium graminearum]|nr:unnamed protein product [Fusarium graminearum]